MIYSDRLITPDEGLHLDVPNQVYHDDWHAVSRSELLVLKQGTPGELDHRRRNPRARKVSPEMLIGSMVDDGLYKAREFWELYVPAPVEFNARKKADREWREEQEAQGKRVVTSDQIALSDDMVSALHKSDLARQYLGCSDFNPFAPAKHAIWQASVVYVDPETGVRIKVRPDTILRECAIGPAVVDLKTTADSSPEGFLRAVEYGDGHWQAALYLWVCLEVLGLDIPEFFWVVVGREPPHRVEVYRCGLASIEAAREEIRAALNLYARCERSGIWPSNSGRVKTLDLRSWKLR